MRIKLIIIVGLLLQACQTAPPKHNPSTVQALAEINAAIIESDDTVKPVEAESQTALPPAVSQALLPTYEPNLPVANQIVTERFDITVNRMPARTFFMSLVKDTPINIVVHPDVKGQISLALKSVTIDEVLEVTRDVYGYEYQKNRAGYFILPARLQSKIFNVSYLNVARRGISNTRVTSGQFSNSDEGNEEAERSNLSRRINNGRDNARAFATSQIATASEANFWQDLDDTLRTIIGPKEGRSVVVSPQSGLVVVRAMPGELREVAAFLQQAQLNLTRQVIIEAKVIEVQLNDTHQTGVNWAALDESASRSNFGNQLKLFDGASEIVDSEGNLLVSGITSTQNLKGIGNLFALGTITDDFAMIIRLLNQQGAVNVLSSPRVSTMNNQKAVIKVGSDEFFVTEISSTTTTGTSTTTTPEIILTPFFSGIALDVTPHINAESDVILHIHPAISEVVDQVKDITVAGQDQSLPLAFSTVRESDSIVRAKSGQVIVIGGLMQHNRSDTVGGVPGLSKVPVLKHLFRQQDRQSRRSELVILLKPVVINDNQPWQTELRQVSERIDQLKR